MNINIKSETILQQVGALTMAILVIQDRIDYVEVMEDEPNLDTLKSLKDTMNSLKRLRDTLSLTYVRTTGF